MATAEELAEAKEQTLTKWNEVQHLLWQAIVQSGEDCAYCKVHGRDECEICPVNPLCLKPIHTDTTRDIVRAHNAVKSLIAAIEEV